GPEREPRTATRARRCSACCPPGQPPGGDGTPTATGPGCPTAANGRWCGMAFPRAGTRRNELRTRPGDRVRPTFVAWEDVQVTTTPPELCLVVGDEELLATRAVAEVCAAVRADDPEADVRELEAAALVVGELAEVLSPSLFGGRRVLVL